MVLVIGGLALIVLAFVAYATGRLLYVGIMGVVAPVLVGLVVLERYVVTEWEEVETVIFSAAAAVETNDPEEVLQFVSDSPDVEWFRRRIRAAMEIYQIEFARIDRDLEITINRTTHPRYAVARFIAFGKGRIRGGQTIYEHAPPHRFEVRLNREGETWKIVDYEMEPAISL